MCGIGVVIDGQCACVDPSVVVLAREGIRKALEPRGPDSYDTVASPCGRISAHASVLGLRGPLTHQPVPLAAAPGAYLLWNGEVFDDDGDTDDADGKGMDADDECGCENGRAARGDAAARAPTPPEDAIFDAVVEVPPGKNDTAAVARFIDDAVSRNDTTSPIDAFAAALARSRGPHAAILCDMENGNVACARDPLGRRSLVWSFVPCTCPRAREREDDRGEDSGEGENGGEDGEGTEPAGDAPRERESSFASPWRQCKAAVAVVSSAPFRQPRAPGGARGSAWTAWEEVPPMSRTDPSLPPLVQDEAAAAAAAAGDPPRREERGASSGALSNPACGFGVHRGNVTGVSAPFAILAGPPTESSVAVSLAFGRGLEDIAPRHSRAAPCDSARRPRARVVREPSGAELDRTWAAGECCGPATRQAHEFRSSVLRELSASVRARVEGTRAAVLFSGGVDSAILAALAHRHVPAGEAIDLVNVCLVRGGRPQSDAPAGRRVLSLVRRRMRRRDGRSVAGPGEEQEEPGADGVAAAGGVLVSGDTETLSYAERLALDADVHEPAADPPPRTAPDRFAAVAGAVSLARACPDRTFRLFLVDVPAEEGAARRDLVQTLLAPRDTLMDLSIGSAFHFAALRAPPEARVVLLGGGADEQFGGYTRHRNAHRHGGWSALAEELRVDIERLHARNLGRDDRVVAACGREGRFPFLAERVVRAAARAQPWELCDPRREPGEGDKYVLRQIARDLGLAGPAKLVKKAVQFGSRFSRIEAPRGKGTQKFSSST